MRGVVSTKLEPFLQQANQATEEAKLTGTAFNPDTIRENLNKLAPLIGQGPKLEIVRDVNFTFEDHLIPARVYGSASKQPMPVVIHYHGGGHMAGSLELYDPICRRVAESGQCIVLSVEYRLAPEHPYPAGVDDCQHVLRHYRQGLTGLKFTDDIYIMGDSAGGAICASLAMRSQDDPTLKIDKQILIYPSVDYCGGHASLKENGTGFLLEQDKIGWYFQQYFRSFQDRKSVSPLRGKISKNLPETFIVTAGCDPLRDEGLAYVKALELAGVAVKHFQFDDLIHAYMLLDSIVSEECRKTYQMIGQFIKK